MSAASEIVTARRARRALSTFVRLPLRDQLTIVRVTLLIAIVEVALRTTTVPRAARLLGVRLDFSPVGDVDARRLERDDLAPRARRQLRCTRRVANAWPFGSGPCLRRSFVAGRLLRHDGAAVRIGVTGDRSGLHAHAWLEIGGQPIEDVGTFSAFELTGVPTPTGP